MTLGAELVPSAYAQTVPKSLEQGGTDAALKERINKWTVGVSGGQLSGTYMTFADELAQVLNDGDNLRVLPLVTHGAAANLDDLLYLRQIDLVMTQSDIFEYFRIQRKTHNLQNKIHYITRLPLSEMHLLARTDIRSIEDLRGKKVSFGPAGSASSLTGTIVFQRLGVKVEQVLLDNPTALQKLKSGELAALVRVIGKPVDFFRNIPPNSGLHLVPIPWGLISKNLTDHYTLGQFTSQEYPTLIPQGERIDTVAVPAVLAVYNWPKDTDRYRRVRRFTEAFFTKWDKFTEPHRHPKWRDVNLAATVPGWTRWSVAEEMLQRREQKQRPAVSSFTQEQRDTLFQEFLKWQKQQNTAQEQRDALFREFLEWQKQHSTERERQRENQEAHLAEPSSGADHASSTATDGAAPSAPAREEPRLAEPLRQASADQSASSATEGPSAPAPANEEPRLAGPVREATADQASSRTTDGAAPSAPASEEPRLAEPLRGSTVEHVTEPTSPNPGALPPDEIAAFLKRGQELARSGDIAAARVLLLRAAEARDPIAALTLAATFDPIILERVRASGVVPDVASALRWYEKAEEFGSKEAPLRLVALRRREMSREITNDAPPSR
jgi:TRAP transporter TAXI family solute receptor